MDATDGEHDRVPSTTPSGYYSASALPGAKDYKALASIDARLDQHFALHHFTTRGHRGKILCLAANADLTCIATGGEDATARVWHFDAETESFKLSATLEHDDPTEAPVSALALLGPAGPLVTAVNTGFLWLWRLDETALAQEGAAFGAAHLGHAGRGCNAVNELCVADLMDESEAEEAMMTSSTSIWAMPRNSIAASKTSAQACETRDDGGAVTVASAGEDGLVVVTSAQACEARADGSAVTVASAGEDGRVVVWAMTCPAQGAPSIEQLRDLPHTAPVLSVCRLQLPPTWKGGAQASALVACTASQVHLWSPLGETLATLAPDGGCGELRRLAVSQDGSLIVAAATGHMCVWCVLDESVLGEGEQRQRLDGTWNCKSPLKPLHWFQCRDCADGLFDVGKNELVYPHVRDFGCPLVSLHLSCLQSQPSPDTNAKNGARLLRVLMMPARVTAMLLRTSRLCGTVLVCACADGTACAMDARGINAGEIFATLRALEWWELFLPIINIVVSFAQMSAFAFGPDIPWPEQVAGPVKITRKIAFIDMDFTVDKALLYWPRVIAVLLSMSVLICFALTDLSRELMKFHTWLQQTPRFHAEHQAGGSWVEGSWLQPVTMLTKAINFLRHGLFCFVMLATNYAVVPMMRVCAVAVDCDRLDGGQLVVTEAPSIFCHQGVHLWLDCVMALVLPAYVLLLIPYAAVQGNASYVQRNELFSLNDIRQNAVKKATAVNLGPFHPEPQNAFASNISDMMVKVLLPCIAILTTTRPVLQMSCCSLATAAHFGATLKWPPFIDPRMRILLSSLRVFTFCSMLTGLLTVLVHAGLVKHVGSSWSLEDKVLAKIMSSSLLIGVIAALLIAWTALRLWRADIPWPKVLRVSAKEHNPVPQQEEHEPIPVETVPP